ncbi:MAG: lipocalin family protein [Armatimonadetes bacterium]|nr:lipocalin family protein [Armatimonadota bacterium]
MPRWLAALVFTLLLTGCGGAESQLAGTWRFVPDTSNPAPSQFAKAFDANINMKMTIRADGTYTETTDSFQYGSLTVPSTTAEGTWTLSNNEFTKTERTMDGAPSRSTSSTILVLSEEGDKLEGTSGTGSKLTYIKE